jgi:hypothetical protein
MLPGNELPLDRRRIGANGRFELADGGDDREEGGSRCCVQMFQVLRSRCVRALSSWQKSEW